VKDAIRAGRLTFSCFFCVSFLTWNIQRSGIFNDLGSGSNVDITVIKTGGEVSRFRTYENAAGNASSYKAQYARPTKLTPPPGTTFVVTETFRPHKNKSTPVVAVPASTGGAMEE
jgi:hypothetical protein